MTICVIAVLSIIIKLPNYCLISIPLFTIGIMGSLFNKGYLYKTLIGLILWGIVICLFVVADGMLVVHSIINYILIFIAILLLAKFPVKKKLPIPAVLGDISFDIYLVHNKVLMALRVLLPIVPLFYFVGLMTVFSALFYLLRKKLSI